MTHDLRIRVQTERDIVITERGTHETCLGPALWIKIWARGYPVLGWREVWEAFAQVYPGRWAVQIFPPTDYLVDGKNVYHIWVLESKPEGFDLR